MWKCIFFLSFLIGLFIYYQQDTILDVVRCYICDNTEHETKPKPTFENSITKPF